MKEIKLYLNDEEISLEKVIEEGLVPTYMNEEIVIYREPTQEDFNKKRIPIIEARLKKLDQDFRQVDLGAIIPDIEERKAEFITLHNELRQLLGKPAREYRNSNLSEN